MELYIEGTQVDLDEKVQIQMVKQLTDVYDPSKIKNDHSRTITIPNTPNNNKVFGKVWSVDKTINYNALLPNQGKNFNPSKKANFILYENGTVYEKGYLKLNEILFEDKKNWRYSITLFGERGDFLSKFDDTTLYDFFKDGVNPYNKNGLIYTSRAAFNLYNTHLNSTRNRITTTTDIYDTQFLNGTYKVDTQFQTGITNIYVDYIENEQGIPHSGAKNYMLYYGKNDDEEKKTSDFKANFSEQQVANRASRFTRLGFYNDHLIMGLIKKMGYSLNMTTDWVQKINPYWFKTLITAPIYHNPVVLPHISELDIYSTDHRTYNIGVRRMHYGLSNFQLQNSLDNVFENGQITVPVNIKDNYGTTRSWNLLTHKSKNNIKYVNYNREFKFNLDTSFIEIEVNSAPYLYAELTPNNTTTVYYIFRFFNEDKTFERVYTLWGDETNTLNSSNYYLKHKLVYTGRFHKIQVEISGKWVDFDVYINGEVNFEATNNLINNDKTYVIVEAEESMSSTFGYHQTGFPLNNVSNNNITFRNINLKGTTTYYLKGVTEMGSSVYVDYYEIMPNLSIKEYFFGYIKLFGLYPVIDEFTKTVKLLTRNEYFGSGKTMDWDGKLDLSGEHSNNPLTFKDKFIELSYKENDDYVTKVYKDNLGVESGSLKLNTGTEFNNSVYKLFEDIPFYTQPIANAYKNIHLNNDTNHYMLHLYEDSINSSKTTDKPMIIFNSGSKFMNYKLLRSLGIWFYTNDPPFTTVQGWRHNFLNWDKFSTSDLRYFLGQRLATGLGIEYQTSSNVKFNTTLDDVNNPKWSLDISQPTYLAYDIDNYPTNGTIYKRIWEKYLLDRYSVNTRIFEGHFYLSKKELATLELNNFIWFKNKYWVIDKIEYSLTEEKLSKVRLVSVNDRTNYTNGINLSNTIDNIGGKE